MQMTPAVVLGHTVTIALSNLLNQLVTKSVLNNHRGARCAHAVDIDMYKGNYKYLGDPTPSARSTNLSDLPIPCSLESLESSNMLDDSSEGV